MRFPFGYGLSYTNFAYANLEVTSEAVEFTLTNTGTVAGAEIAQLYISIKDSVLFRPAIELKGFAKVYLEPGESKKVRIKFDDKSFRYFNVKTGKWEVEGGVYTISVGPNAEELPLKGSLEVKGTNAPVPYDKNTLECYFNACVQDVPDKQFEALIGRPIPQKDWDITAKLEMNDSLLQLYYARNPLARLAGKILENLKRKSEIKGKPNLNVLFIYNMPFRGLAKMTNGMVSMDMAASILDICNGHFFRGLGGTIKGFFANRRMQKERRKSL